MAFDTGCLFSTIKNISGGRAKLSFLPPHGRELDDDEEFTCLNSIMTELWRLDGQMGRRKLEAFERAVAAGVIEIVKTPSPIIYDAHSNVDAPRMLQISDSVITSVAPCFANEL